jgi:tripartite motif-containing protein 71
MDKFIRQWGSPGSGPGQFSGPQDIAIDSSGMLYVVDSFNNRIQKFTHTGQLAFPPGWAVDSPSRIAIDSNDILYVTINRADGLVQKFNTVGVDMGTFGEGQLTFPVGIDVDSAKNVYVAESGITNNQDVGNRVSKFSSTGQFIKSWGSFGSADGQFAHPKGLDIDSQDDVFVADDENNRIQKFDKNGNFITQFGSDRLVHPIDVADDTQGRIYASDLDEILIYGLSNPPIQP